MTAGLLSIFSDAGWAKNPCENVEADEGLGIVQAACRWNDTGVDWVEGRHYLVKVEGAWSDASILTNAKGYRSNDERVSALGRPFLRLTERWRPVPEGNWFSLICTIGKDNNGWIDIGAKLSDSGYAEVIAPTSGRLYCAANDLLFMYWNNSGRLILTFDK